MTTTTRHVVALTSLLAVSVALNIVLHLRIGGLNQRIAMTEYTNYGPALNVGDPAPSWQVHSLAGLPIVIPTTGVKTVFYVFAPTCHWCAQNERNIVALAQQHLGFRFVAVALRDEGLAQFVADKHLPFETVSLPAWDTQYRYGLGATPMTIVTTADGHVAEIWRGAFSGNVERAVSSFFGVQLPGLDLLPPAPDNPGQ